MEESIFAYQSEFQPEVQVIVVFKESDQYPQLKPYFDTYGYGFFVPGKDMMLIDGENLLEMDSSPELLKFIEAHEISHYIMGHDGPRSEDDELDADLGAYILLNEKGYTDSIKLLLRNFKTRHGVKFSMNLLDRVKKFLPQVVGK
jgi:hypothetical protein